MSFIVGQRVLSASGGTISTITGYTVHTFTSSGSFTPNQNGTVEVLVVGAGGSIILNNPSPTANSSGGGGGSVIYRKLLPVGAGVSYSIEIGQVVAPISTASTFTHPQGPITAPGGGSGIQGTPTGGGNASGISNPVGSGGGGVSFSIPGIGTGGVGAGIIGFGFPGGTGINGTRAGGGGAGGPGFGGGSPSPSYGGNGGIGVSYSITGVSSYYGAGGGGQQGGPLAVPGSINNGISLPQVSIYGRGKNGPGGAAGTDGPGVVIIRYIN